MAYYVHMLCEYEHFSSYKPIVGHCALVAAEGYAAKYIEEQKTFGPDFQWHVYVINKEYLSLVSGAILFLAVFRVGMSYSRYMDARNFLNNIESVWLCS